MPPENPLEIPEILLHVVSYLNLKPKDVARFLRVSKCWHNILLPLRWRAVIVEMFGRRCHSQRLFGPRPDAIRRHRHLIRDLTIVDARSRSKIDQWTYSNLKTLTLHYNTLVKLDLGHCILEEGFHLASILCNCPSLEILSAYEGVCAEEVAENGPWVCRLLRELTLGFWFDNEDQGLHQVVLQQLSTLDRLESLEIFYALYDADYTQTADFAFRLDLGLWQLASLRQLKTLTFIGDSDDTIKPQLGIEEIEWMATNWTQLKRVAGQFSRSPEEHAILKDAFILRGIEVCEQPRPLLPNDAIDELDPYL